MKHSSKLFNFKNFLRPLFKKKLQIKPRRISTLSKLYQCHIRVVSGSQSCQLSQQIFIGVSDMYRAILGLGLYPYFHSLFAVFKYYVLQCINRRPFLIPHPPPHPNPILYLKLELPPCFHNPCPRMRGTSKKLRKHLGG